MVGSVNTVRMNKVHTEESLLADPLLTLMGLVFETAAGGQAQLDKLLSDGPVSWQLFDPLVRLSRSDGGKLRMTDLAAQCRCSASALTRVADRLEALDLAEREASPTDRRVVYLRITSAGRRAVLNVMPEHVRTLDHQVFGSLSHHERLELEGLLRKVRDAVHPDAAAVTANDD